ncbi:MAG: hypothetical protein DCC73_14360 [Proteobacteria bacterium]|nr:MAG: hypothetical protein DCC73_14360 [Pseudomonadota bacterium]
MKKAIIISALGHAALIAFLAMKLPFLTRETEVIEEEFVPAELVERLEEVAKAPPPPREEPKPEEKPVEEQQAAVEPEPTPPDDAVPLPEPEKKPKEAEKPEPKTPAASPKRKPTPPSRFSASRIAALLDKSVEEAPTAEAPQKPFDASKLLERPQRSAIDTAQMAASLRSLIRSQVEPCWSVPAGARGAEELQVKIRIYLLPNGALARAPEIVDSARMYAPGQEFFRVAAESARRAIQRCAPLKLPADTYDIWRETELIFDPKEMLGG